MADSELECRKVPAIIIEEADAADAVGRRRFLEKRLVNKVDRMVLSFCGLMYFVNYLDRANLTNAYVSGMKADLKFVGSDLTKLNTTFLIGYVISQVPSNLIIQRVAPRYWFSFCVLSWGVLTLGSFRVTTVWQFYPIRFFMGVLEASTFAGTQFIMGSWYKSSEIAKRSAIFACMGRLGALCSGIMQGTIHTTLNGRAGLEAWRWLFLIDGVITIPIALYGFLYFPDTPEHINARCFSIEERQLAISRLPSITTTRMDWTIIRRVLCKWHWWFFTGLWIITSAIGSVSTNSLFFLYLQDKKYSIEQRNYYPQGINAIAIGSLLLLSTLSDRLRMRWQISIILCISGVLSGMLIWLQTTESLAFVGFFLSGVPFCAQAIFFAWANEVCQQDVEERAVVLASMLMGGSIFTSWWSLIFYAADDGPIWRHGMLALIITSIILLPYCYLGHMVHCRESRVGGRPA